MKEEESSKQGQWKAHCLSRSPNLSTIQCSQSILVWHGDYDKLVVYHEIAAFKPIILFENWSKCDIVWHDDYDLQIKLQGLVIIYYY